MNASETSTERLKCVSRPARRLASMKSATSGCSHESVPIIAPRRGPTPVTVSDIWFHSSMNETGPDAMPPVASAGAARGRSVEKSMPMPPPCCIVSADSRSAAKMPSSESSTVPITKQLNSVTRRAVPAPARMRPPGRNLKSSSTSRKRPAQCPRSRGSAAASARATRSNVASIDASAGPEAGTNR